MISIHALREEGDRPPRPLPVPLSDFYPRPPRGGRLLAGIFFFEPTLISIHALREEGDSPASPGERTSHISIHALREEGDDWDKQDVRHSFLFLSTPSARRATAP